jgi:hypothetical protein
MPRHLNRARRSQPTLFYPPESRPPFQTLPRDIQEKTIWLLARLLRLQTDHRLTSNQMLEARDE